MTQNNHKKIAIVGPTASGKTGLSLQIAQRYDGEIINADSRNVYIGMDIGTAMPTQKEQKIVTHHLINIIKPNETYNLSRYQADAQAVIAAAGGEERLPIVVGGSGLYIDSLLYDYDLPGNNSNQHVELDELSDDALRTRLLSVDAAAEQRIDMANRRRVIRAIELAGERGHKRGVIDPSWLVIGLNPGKEILYKKIVQRAEEQLATGLIAETKKLIHSYGEHIESLNTVPYREVIAYLHGELNEVELPQKIATKNWQLARRQLTWFKRNLQIQWFEAADDALQIVEAFINSDE